MFNWLFKPKKDSEKFEKVREDTKKGFDAVREDVNNLSKWIKHLNSQDSKHEFAFSEVDERLSSIENEIEGLKNALSFMEGNLSKRVFKQPQTAALKQTAVQGVQIDVQTAVQTGGKAIFENLSVMERALIHIMANTEMKLSYDDLAAMLGKSRATIRGQINTIRQKSDGLVQEVIEANGKKRVFIPEEIREMLVKSGKVRVNKKKKDY